MSREWTVEMTAFALIAICVLIAFVLASCVVRDLWPPEDE